MRWHLPLALLSGRPRADLGPQLVAVAAALEPVLLLTMIAWCLLRRSLPPLRWRPSAPGLAGTGGADVCWCCNWWCNRRNDGEHHAGRLVLLALVGGCWPYSTT